MCSEWSCGCSRWLYTPAVRSSHDLPCGERQLFAYARALPLLSQEVLQGGIIEHRIGQHPLELDVLVFQRPKPLGLRHIHAAELRFPFVDAAIADPVLAAQIRNRDTSLVLLQYPDDLLFRKAAAFHV